MSAPVLIAYATRSGSTFDIAEAICITLREAGLAAHAAPVDAVTSLEGTTTLILGAPLYMGRLPKEFHAFLRLHQNQLARLAPWCFVVGPTRNRPSDFTAARKQAERQLRRYPWLQPAELHVFGGRWDPRLLPSPFRFMLRIPGNPLGKIPPEDIRDWPAIPDWSAAIAQSLRTAA